MESLARMFEPPNEEGPFPCERTTTVTPMIPNGLSWNQVVSDLPASLNGVLVSLIAFAPDREASAVGTGFAVSVQDDTGRKRETAFSFCILNPIMVAPKRP